MEIEKEVRTYLFFRHHHGQHSTPSGHLRQISHFGRLPSRLGQRHRQLFNRGGIPAPLAHRGDLLLQRFKHALHGRFQPGQIERVDDVAATAAAAAATATTAAAFLMGACSRVGGVVYVADVVVGLFGTFEDRADGDGGERVIAGRRLGWETT